MPGITLTVVKAYGAILERALVKVLRSVDLPTEGKPKRITEHEGKEIGKNCL